MLRLALVPAFSPTQSIGSASDFWCLVVLRGPNNMEGLTARELTSIRSSMKIKFLVIGKLANN
jgi:hypothetical protein